MKNGYEEHELNWRGQILVIRWCPNWSPNVISHLEIVTKDHNPHPISKTGYQSHFCPRAQVEDFGGPVAYVTAWLQEADDGKPVQLTLF